MQQALSKRSCRLMAVVWGLTALTVGVGAARAESLSIRSAPSNLLWQQACRRIIAGEIDGGIKAIHQLEVDQPDHPDLSQVRRWLADYEKLQAQRDQFRQADHEHEVAQTKQSVEKGEWLVAMRYLCAAYDTSEDPNAFTKAPWTTEVVAQAKEHVDGLYRKGEWAEAAGIYACLEHLYEDEPQYERMKRTCLRHARLEVIYKKENQASWEKALSGIEPGMVREAFLRVGSNYVSEANFKAALAGGIENVLILAKTTNLAETFPRLGDREAVVRFTGEVTLKKREIEDADAINAREAFEYFKDVLKTNARTLGLPTELVVSEFMDGALYPLDHYSNMIWPAEVEEFKKQTMGKFQGVGIQIRKREDGKLLVVTPLPGTPAHRAGIQSGDLILEVDGEEIAALEVDEIVPKIMGPKGTTVKLTIQRGKKKPFVIPIERDVITITSIRGYRRDEDGKWDYMIDPEQRIGYIRIDPSFMDGTVQEMKEVLDELDKKGARALLLDLRWNPGGLLRTAIDVTQLFLPPGKEIVSTRGLRSDEWSAPSSTPAVFKKDMVVLVNETSASASEILAGALQDHHRAIVLGTRTHGKGSVQNLIPLANDAAYLKLTTAQYYLPSNRCPDKRPGAKDWGVTPDIAVPLRPEEKIKVVQMRRDSDVLGEVVEPEPASQPATTSSSTQTAASTQPTTGPTPVKDRPNIDPQAEAALLVLRVKLLSGQPWTWVRQSAPAASRKTARAR